MALPGQAFQSACSGARSVTTQSAGRCMNDLFPVFLRLKRRRALVVGGGTMASLRVGQLLAAGAIVTVIAPDLGLLLEELAGIGVIEAHRRVFVPEDITREFFIVIGATNDPQIQSSLAQEAERHGVLFNVVDDVDHCNFFTPAVVERGDLKIAISTNGQSPVLARFLREQIEAALPEGTESWVRQLGELRRTLKLDASIDFGTRKQIIEEVIERTFAQGRSQPH